MKQQGKDTPAAYDTQGRPLYYRPEQKTEPDNNEPQIVQITKPSKVIPIDIPEDIKHKHHISKQRYPFLNLSEGEYVVSAVRRHPIGLFSIWLGVIGAAAVIMLAWGAAIVGSSSDKALLSPGGFASGSAFVIGLIVLVVLFGVIATWVYQGNKFFLTNESVIQHIQVSLFSQNDQIVNLDNIEDASYRQVGILQFLLNYGSIRLSTQGEETTYRFHYVANPKKQIDMLNNVIEAFKNGRPIGDY